MDSLKLAFRSDSTVLITGPTGSGKTRLAAEIHQKSCRSSKPFVQVNLASLHEGTLESELFGHERGAFTGADSRRVGRLEAAQGGTVFLDEVGELTPRLQARLLEFLQSKTIVPVGGNKEIHLNVRVIAATHQNLNRAVIEGRFREDLFHRIRVISVRLKSLAERQDELDQIIHDCLEDLSRGASRTILKISKEVANRLEQHPWPGNFRELRNVLEFAVLAAEGGEVKLEHLPDWFQQEAFELEKPKIGVLGTAEIALTLDYQDAISGFEKLYLTRALSRYQGRVNLTARQIGLNKTTLLRRIRTHQLHPQALSGLPSEPKPADFEKKAVS